MSHWSDLIEQARKKQQERDGIPVQSAATNLHAPATSVTFTPADLVADVAADNGIRLMGSNEPFTWNKEQLEAIALARQGKSFCLIGAAGTGKTTTEKEIARVLVSENIIPVIDIGTKHLLQGVPGIVFTSFTRRAVRNMKRVVSADLQPHCITLHKLLEYEPVFYEVEDPVTHEFKKTMRFEPQRNNMRKLPHTLKTIVIDESSMVSALDLFAKLISALPNPDAVQFIFVGDLHQLPPVYGSAVLGFKLLELPTIELTQIYRQAAKSPIIALAHKIKNGEKIPVITNTTTETDQGKVTLRPWKKPLTDFDAMYVASAFLKELVIQGHFDEEEDVVLCPQEKTKNTAFGTNEFNKVLAQALGEVRKQEDGSTGAIVHEVIAGYIPHYLAVGDRLLVGREDAVITKITKNARYWGKRPRTASKELDRWGNYKIKVAVEAGGDADDFDMDKYLESFTLENSGVDEEKKQEASHVIDVQLLDSGASETLSTAGEINAAQFAYCLTVHKSQGSEWNRVFFLTHQSHVAQWSRELLYTAVTRARKELYCIIEPDRGSKDGTLSKAARSPRIKGNTLAEKAKYFQGKSDEFEETILAARALPQGRVVAGEYQGEHPDSDPEGSKKPKAENIPDAPPVKLIRLCEFVSSAFRAQAENQLNLGWARAKMIWGERIGLAPVLDFNLQSSKIIGQAVYASETIRLNALWCILADENEKFANAMLMDTIPHEIAHFIDWRYNKNSGHGESWKMIARMLGANPASTTDEFPNWAQSYRQLMNEKMSFLKSQNADLGEES